MAQPALPRPRTAPRLTIEVVYQVEPRDDLFLLEEETMPESLLHDEVLVLLQVILRAWAARSGRDLVVARNLACRLDPSDARVGVDPDLCVLEPSPPDRDLLTQLRLWEPDRQPPWLGIEVVSGSTAPKDYRDAPVKYARLGVRELWVFDPRREGPSDTGGPFTLQVWHRDGTRMERTYAGSGPVRSPELGAWLVVTDAGRKLRLADDAAGTRLWPTEAESEAADRRRADVDRQREREARERAEAEVAALRAELAALKAGRT